MCRKRNNKPRDNSINRGSLVAILKACAKQKDIDNGIRLHAEILRRHSLGERKNRSLGNTLISMYAKCGFPAKAQQVLEGLPARNVVSWSALISGYAQEGYGHHAIACFDRMQSEGLSPDAVTFASILKACGITGAIEKGKEIHDMVVSRGLLENDIVLGTALVDMYAKCGMLAKAQQVLEELPARDIFSWSALIAGYAQQGQGNQALSCLEKMQTEGISPNAVTFICILKACGSVGAVNEGYRIHEEVLIRGWLEKDLVLGNALVDMYVKCGLLEKAQEVLEKLPIRNVVTWSSLIAGYAEQGKCGEVLCCLERLQQEGFAPNAVTFISILKACGSTGAIKNGKKIHDEIVSRGLLNDIALGTALVDMYAKCGAFTKACQVFEELPFRDKISWSTLISACGEIGQVHEVLNCFKKMQTEGVSPDDITFLNVLIPCGHSGLLDEADTYFGNMKKTYGIDPSIKHHTCMVIILGSAGLFDRALSVIKEMPSFDHLEVWLALLAACRKWGNVMLGKLVFDQAIQLKNNCASVYILMADIFVDAAMQNDAEKVQAMRLEYAPSEMEENVSLILKHGQR